MRLITSLFAVALAIGAVVAPGIVPVISHASVHAADDAKAVLTFAPSSNGLLAPGQDLVITGTIFNPSAKSIVAGSASIRLNRSAVRSRAELSSWLAPASTSSDDALGTEVLTTTTPEAFAAEVGGRVQAIAKAHSLLTQSGHGQVSLRAILQTELAPYDRSGSNLSLSGPDIALTPKAGLALAMALHELASNAAKYGALSTDAGRLSVEWDATAQTSVQALTITWTETGGPAVTPPTRRGFGTTLIERSLGHELDAQVAREFLPGGLRCTVAMPLTEEVGRLQPAGNTGETP